MNLLWINYSRPRTAWYGLPPGERGALQAKWGDVRNASKEAGGQQIGIFEVRGQSDYNTAEIWIFPSADDAFDHWARLTAAEYAEWFASANSIGNRIEPSA